MSSSPLPKICALVLGLSPFASAEIPAFPGAEGAGAYAHGGRGGDVYHVTNTNPSGAGSLAYGLTNAVPAAGRTIVFDVSGYAHISGELRITASKITIAGQTAPGDGFGLKDGTFRVSGDDIVIRHLRFRDGNSADAIDLDSGSLNSIFDHCDAMLSNDENMSSFGSPPENLTWQWGVNAWGMESHSAGGLWDQNHATCHHSLWAHNHTRNPKARPSLLDWRNNVTFDWDIGFILGDSTTPANWNANVVANYFIAATSGKSKALEKGAFDRNGVPNFHVYLSNNRFDGNLNGLVDGTDTGFGMVSDQTKVEHLATALVNPGIAVTTEDPLLAYKKVVSAAGPLRMDVDVAKPLRDQLATILATELVAQTHHHVSSPAGTGASNGGFGALNSTSVPVDSDKDGMPDFYEDALGWSKATDDHNTVLANSGGLISGTTFFPAGTVAGYTRLEEYLHFLALPHGTLAKNVSGTPSSIAVDLRKFTSGFSASPTFTVASVSGGSVALSGAGNAIATFTPTEGYTGRARFDFTVLDGAGSTWTQTCALVVATSGLPRDLVWVGDGATNPWDETSLVWKRNGVAIDFNSADSVTLDDTGSHASAVNPQGTLAAPSAMLVDTSGTYTFAGTGSIAASGRLTKRGTGTLTFLNPGNTFASGTIEAGTVKLGVGGGIGGGTFTLLDGATFANLYVDSQPGVPMPFDVPAGNSATIATGNRVVLSGAVTGAGTLTYLVQTTVTRANFKGPMAAFTGDLNFTGSGGVRLFFNGGAFNGFDGASVDIGGSVSLQPHTNSGGNIFNIGALSGTSTTANLSGGDAGTATIIVGGNGESTSYAGGITGNAIFTKTGVGALTLTGLTSYTGATTVSTGELIANGVLGPSGITVASGAKLRGAGSIAGALTMQAGSQLSPGATTGAVGTLTLGSAGLNLQGATLSLQLSAMPAGANDRVQLGGGTLALSGTNTIAFSLADGVLGAGAYDLITGGAATTGGLANLSATFPSGARQTFALAVPAGKVQLIVTGDPATLTWTSGASGLWNGADVNWTGGSPNTFFALDAVVFDDSAANRNVSIASSVGPRSVLVNTTLGYTFAGVGTLDGAGVLVKNGAGTLTFAGSAANTFSGGLTLNAGTIELATDAANAGALGTGTVTLNGGVISMHDDATSYNAFNANLFVPAGATARLNADSRVDVYGTLAGAGTLNFFVPFIRTTLFSDWSAFTGVINVITDGDGGDFRMGSSYYFPGFPQAALVLADKVWASYTGTLASGAGTTIEIGELAGGALSGLVGGGTGGRNFTYRIGGRNTDAIFAGTIQEQNSATTTSFVKTGAGIWTLSGSCAWNGGTEVEQGTLKITGNVGCVGATNVALGAALNLAGGALATDALNIEGGATFIGGGNATITGDFNNSGMATLSSGTFNVTGDVVNSGTLRLTGGTALNCSGGFVNGGVLDLLTGAGSLPANFTNDGVVILNTDRRVLSTTKSGATFSCTVWGYAGHTYLLQRADAPGGAWANLGGAQAGAGALITCTDAGGATGAARYYRVLVQP